jgi:hypothetical protein
MAIPLKSCAPRYHGHVPYLQHPGRSPPQRAFRLGNITIIFNIPDLLASPELSYDMLFSLLGALICYSDSSCSFVIALFCKSFKFFQFFFSFEFIRTSAMDAAMSGNQELSEVQDSLRSELMAEMKQ